MSALIEELNPICKNGGGFMGLFVNKNSCNAIELSLGNNCVFNPISGGYFNSFLDESLGIGEFERQSCQSRCNFGRRRLERSSDRRWK